MNFYKNKKVLITGDTGFKGSWLGIWLSVLGANVKGISNKIEKTSNYTICNLEKLWEHKNIDIRNNSKFINEIENFKPDIIFHLAAQSLVYKAKENPKYTIGTNILGTFNLINYLRQIDYKCSLVIVSTDKVYKEKKESCKENDLLGSSELYGASKACSDIISQAFYNTYFKNTNVGIAISRAGNIIGGGDYSKNRLIPDIVLSLRKNKSVIIRNPNFTRPWQYILDVLYAYLILGEKLYNNPNKYSDIFNFGPKKSHKVIDLVNKFISFWGSGNYTILNNQNFYENDNLLLNSQKALRELNWKNTLSFEKAIKLTVEDYKHEEFGNILEKRIFRINNFQNSLRNL